MAAMVSKPPVAPGPTPRPWGGGGSKFSGVNATGYALVYSGATGDLLLTLNGIHENELTGYSVAGIGDVNGVRSCPSCLQQTGNVDTPR